RCGRRAGSRGAGRGGSQSRPRARRGGGAPQPRRGYRSTRGADRPVNHQRESRVRQAGWLASAALLLGLGTGLAQQHEGAAEHGSGPHEAAAKHEEGGNEGGLEIWKWANFALLAGALGWIIRKNAGPFFEARSLEIRKQLAEAEAIHAEAKRRTAEVEARLAGLEADI